MQSRRTSSRRLYRAASCGPPRYGERIASRASRRPLGGGLRPVLTDSRLTSATRSADGPVRSSLRDPCPLVAVVFASVRCTNGLGPWTYRHPCGEIHHLVMELARG